MCVFFVYSKVDINIFLCFVNFWQKGGVLYTETIEFQGGIYARRATLISQFTCTICVYMCICSGYFLYILMILIQFYYFWCAWYQDHILNWEFCHEIVMLKIIRIFYHTYVANCYKTYTDLIQVHKGNQT